MRNDGDPGAFPGNSEACDGVDDDCDPATICAAQTCAEVKGESPGAVDGACTLHIDGDPAQPWDAYCHDMAGTPTSCLTLVNVGPDLNFSQYTAGGQAPGTDVRTNYTRVRLDAMSLRVDIDVVTFSSSTGTLMHGQKVVTKMQYGTAESCDHNPSGLGNIDLSGTPFSVASLFCLGGNEVDGVAMFSSDDQVVDFTGGGFCGWNTPSCSIGPQEVLGKILELAYIGP